MDEKKLEEVLAKMTVEELEEKIAPDKKCGSGSHLVVDFQTGQRECVPDDEPIYIMAPR